MPYQIAPDITQPVSVPEAGERSSSSSTADFSPTWPIHRKHPVVERVLETGIVVGQIGAILLAGLLPIAAWLWGVLLYVKSGSAAGAICAFLVPPIGELHAIGLF